MLAFDITDGEVVGQAVDAWMLQPAGCATRVANNIGVGVDHLGALLHRSCALTCGNG